MKKWKATLGVKIIMMAIRLVVVLMIMTSIFSSRGWSEWHLCPITYRYSTTTMTMTMTIRIIMFIAIIVTPSSKNNNSSSKKRMDTTIASMAQTIWQI